jgi:predicted phage terminase large subunit-like protein
LCPERFGEKELSELESDLGEYAAAGQLQQRPHPRGGGMFKRENFRILEDRDFNRKNIMASVRYWDKAATTDTKKASDSKRTAGVLMHRMRDKSFVIEDCIKGKWAATQRERIIKQTAEMDGKAVQVWVEQEPGSGGKESAQSTVINLAGYIAKADRVTGTKEVRAEPYASQVGIQNVYLLRRDWTTDFIAEHESFPTGTFADMVDASSGAFNHLFSLKKAGTFGTRK